jgi:hypothetical protein
MPRKYNDPIMKSKNKQTNGETSSNSGSTDNTQYTPGYTPQNIKNGINFSDLADDLKNAIGGNYNFSTGDSSFNFIGGGNDINISSMLDLINQNGGNGINFSSLLSLLAQGGNGFSSLLNQLLAQGGDLSSLLSLMYAAGAGGGSAIEYLETYNDAVNGISYDWFRMELINRTSILFADKAYLNFLLYTVSLDAATQQVQVIDDIDDTTLWTYNSPLAAARPGRTYLGYMDNIISDTTIDGVRTVVYEFKDRLVYPHRERTVVTPSQKALTLPLTLTDIQSDRSIITGATSTVTGTANMPEADIHLTEVTSGGIMTHSTSVGQITDHYVPYSMADSPLTHIQVASGNAYNYSAYPMTASVMRMIISGEVQDVE